MAILGTARHGKSHTINQMLMATELPDRSYNPGHDKHNPWDSCVGATATHAARAVARTLCVEADERESRANATLPKEEREFRFHQIVDEIMDRSNVINKADVVPGNDGIGGECVNESSSEHQRVIWSLPCGPCKGDESDAPEGRAVFNCKGHLNPSCTDTAFKEEAKRDKHAVEMFQKYASGKVGTIGGSDGEFLLPSVQSTTAVTPISIKISGGEQYVNAHSVLSAR